MKVPREKMLYLMLTDDCADDASRAAEPAQTEGATESRVDTLEAGTEAGTVIKERSPGSSRDISHFLSNFITVVNGYSILALRSIDPASPAYRHIEMILEAGEHAAEQMRHLQATGTCPQRALTAQFSKRKDSSAGPARLEEVVASFQRLKP